MFIRPTTFSAMASLRVCSRSSACTSGDKLFGGSEQLESPECTPACSTCSMMPPISTSLPSQQASTSTSMASSRKRSSSTGLSLDTLHRGGHVGAQVFLGEHHFHGAAAQHVGRTHHQREAHFARQRSACSSVRAVALAGCLRPRFLHQQLETFAIFGDVDGIRRGADDGRTRGFERARQLQRRLAAVLHDHALGLFLGDDLEHVFERQRLEVQAVGGVVVGGHGFRIAVDHDGLESVLAQRQRRVHAAVVELDALADAVRSAAEDHDLALGRRRGLAFLFVGGIQVGRGGGEFRRAGVDALVHRTHALARGASRACPFRDCPVSRASRLSENPLRLSSRMRSASSEDRPSSRTRLSSSTRSSICARNQGSMYDSSSMRSLRPAGAERVGHVQQAVGAGSTQLVGQLVAILFGEQRP